MTPRFDHDDTRWPLRRMEGLRHAPGGRHDALSLSSLAGRTTDNLLDGILGARRWPRDRAWPIGDWTDFGAPRIRQLRLARIATVSPCSALRCPRQATVPATTQS